MFKVKLGFLLTKLYFFDGSNFEWSGRLLHKQNNSVAEVLFIAECEALLNAAITLTRIWL